MFYRRTDVAVVNRSFWPNGQVIGEALLQFAENIGEQRRVVVITQAKGDLRQQLDSAGRGRGVTARSCPARSTSSSSLAVRVGDAVVFMFWVLFTLIRERPRKVYVATDPPVVVPFVVFLYAKCFGAHYYYHVQDIHPEAAGVVYRGGRGVFSILKLLDSLVMRSARGLITLSAEMRNTIRERSGTNSPIYQVANPAVAIQKELKANKERDLVFCGNAGRLQLVPLLVDAIREYLRQGGRMTFTFAGGGIHVPLIEKLAEEEEFVEYLGVVSARAAATIVARHRWALLPLDDRVSPFAFPSKSSSYVMAGCNILAICGEGTSIARWVRENAVGRCCRPDITSLVRCLHEIELQEGVSKGDVTLELEQSLTIDRFVATLTEILGLTTYHEGDRVEQGADEC